jgi:hypothetical protein
MMSGLLSSGTGFSIALENAVNSIKNSGDFLLVIFKQMLINHKPHCRKLISVAILQDCKKEHGMQIPEKREFSGIHRR